MHKERLVIAIEPELKKIFQLNCVRRNKKMSDLIRGWIIRDNAKQENKNVKRESVSARSEEHNAANP